MTTKQVETLRLSRPVCGVREGLEVCVLLNGHTGNHVSSKGRSWQSGLVAHSTGLCSR